MLWLQYERISFGGIQFYTALKHVFDYFQDLIGFGGIQFNTALKPRSQFFYCRRLRFLLFVLAKDFRIMNAIVLYFLFILFNFQRTIDKK